MSPLTTTLRITLIATVAAATALGTTIAVDSRADRSPGAVDSLVSVAAVGSQEAPPESPEFIELGYFETTTGGSEAWSISITNCRPAEPAGTICDSSVEPGNGEPMMVGTHIGRALETRSGTTWFGRPCVAADGSESTGTLGESSGTIFPLTGDELHFRLRSESCGGKSFGSYWIVTGGTGRFEDASGIMSSREDPVTGEGPYTSVGTLRVRADRWEDVIPSEPLPLIDPGAVGVEEGNEGQVVVEVPVTLSSPAAEPVTVDWATSDTGAPGVATADVDYVAASGTVTFAPGETSRTVSITINGDTEVEPPLLYGEWGLIEFTNPSPNAVLDDSSALGAVGVFVIIDDD